MKKLLLKSVSIVLLVVFGFNTCCYGLATLPASQNPKAKRKILAALKHTQIRPADSKDAIKLLEANNNAPCLLLSSGKYLVRKDIVDKYNTGDYMTFLRTIWHEDFEALMQVLFEEDRYKYQAIKELILKYFPPDENNSLPINLYVNHNVARAFEWLSLVEEGVIPENKIPKEERAFINAIRPIIMANKHSYFTGEFWDSSIRGERIKNAIEKGMRFYLATAKERKTEQIAPHGGKLINREAKANERERKIEQAKKLPKLNLNEVEIQDFEMIATGTLSPLEGFMSRDDFNSCLDNMRLSNGLVWTIPIVKSVTRQEAKGLSVGQTVTLIDDSGEILGTMQIEDIFEHDKEKHAICVYGTNDRRHPGVNYVHEMGDYLIGGEIELLTRKKKAMLEKYYLTPTETRELFLKKGWKTVVAFQTRNPVHRAHEFIMRKALEGLDGLMIHPLVGKTKSGDIPVEIRMATYEATIENHLPRRKAMLAVFPAHMRYAGPREAVFHAIVRKNYGCTHFIVGRDHAGTGNYYGPFDAQKIFDNFSAHEIGIQPIFFDNAIYCTKCDDMTFSTACPHSDKYHFFLSGSAIREMLSRGEMPPEEQIRKEVTEILFAHTIQSQLAQANSKRALKKALSDLARNPYCKEVKWREDTLTFYRSVCKGEIINKEEFKKDMGDVHLLRYKGHLLLDITLKLKEKTERHLFIFGEGALENIRRVLDKELNFEMTSQRGITLWFTGLSGAGKTTLADSVARKLEQKGIKCERLDGDVLRKTLNRDLGFSNRDRDINIQRVTDIAESLTRAGVVTITSFISPFRSMRDRAREEIGNFVEIYVKCPLEVCEARDTKGLYQKARKGIIPEFTGISSPYEEPLSPEITVETDKISVEEATDVIIGELERLEAFSKKIEEPGRFPVFWRELGLTEQVYFGNLAEIRGFSKLINAEIEEDRIRNRNRHITTIMAEIRNDLEVSSNPVHIRWKESIDELLARIEAVKKLDVGLGEDEKDSEELLFPLDNVVYRALIEAVRSWPKRDLHTHLSNSIPEEEILRMLRFKQEKGDKDFIDRVRKWLAKDADMNPAKNRMMKLLFDENGHPRDYTSITKHDFLAVYDDLQMRSVTDLRDICIDNMEPEEAEEYFIQSIAVVAKHNFADGVREVELRFNPFKAFLYMKGRNRELEPVENWEYLLDSFLRKLDAKLRVAEKEADGIYGTEEGLHRVLFTFSINRDNLAGEKFVNDRWTEKFEILKRIKHRFGYSAYYGERLSGVDVSGIEIFDDAKYKDKKRLLRHIKEKYHLKEMAAILQWLKDSGYTLTTHLGCRYAAKPRTDIEGHSLFVKAHLEEWGHILNRIGHGKIFTRGNVYVEQGETNVSGWEKINPAISKELLERIKANNIIIESAPQKHESRSIYRMMYDLPNSFWTKSNIPVVYGTDGLYLSNGCTLSQWLVRLMLSFPDINERSYGVNSFKEAVSSHRSEREIEDNVLLFAGQAWEYFTRQKGNFKGSMLLVSPNEFLRKTIELSKGCLYTEDAYYRRTVFKKVEEYRKNRISDLIKNQRVVAEQQLDDTRKKAKKYFEGGRDGINPEDIINGYRKSANMYFMLQSALLYPEDILSTSQSIYREMEDFRVRSGSKEKETPFLIVVSTTDRTESLENFLSSVLDDLRTFDYGLVMDLDENGEEIKRWDKVKIVIIENSSNRDIIAKNKEIIQRYRNQGLKVIYYGVDEKIRIASKIKERDGNTGLEYRLGITAKEMADDAESAVTKHIKDRGYSSSRNFSFEITKECLEEMPDETITIFMDDDELIESLVIHPEEGVKFDRAFSFFHVTSTYFKDPEIEILAGNVTGDPPIGGVSMILGNLIDLREFLGKLADLNPDDEYSSALFEGTVAELLENVETELFNDYRSRENWSGKTSLREGDAFLRIPRIGESRTAEGQFIPYAEESEGMLFGKQITRPIAYFPNSYKTDQNMAVMPEFVRSYFGTGGNIMVRKKIIQSQDITCVPTMNWRREDVILERFMDSFVSPVNMAFLPVRHERLTSGHRIGFSQSATGHISFIKFLDSAYNGYVFQRFVEKIYNVEYIRSMEDFIKVATEVVSGKRQDVIDWYVSIKKARLERHRQYFADIRKMAIGIRKRGFLKDKKFWWNRNPKYDPMVGHIRNLVSSIEKELDPENEDYKAVFETLERRAADRSLEEERKIIEKMSHSYPLLTNYIGEHPYFYVSLSQVERELKELADAAGLKTSEVAILLDTGYVRKMNIPTFLPGTKRRLIDVYLTARLFNLLLTHGANKEIFISCDDEDIARGFVKRINRVCEVYGIDLSVRGNYRLNITTVPKSEVQKKLSAFKKKQKQREVKPPGQPEKSGILLSLDLGKTATKIVAYENNRFVYRKIMKGSLYRGRKPSEIRKRVEDLIDETLSEMNKNPQDVIGICVLVPDIVDKNANSTKKIKASDIKLPAIIRHDSEGYAAAIKEILQLHNVYIMTLGTHPGTQAIIYGATAPEPFEMSMSVAYIGRDSRPIQLRDYLSTEAIIKEARHKGIIDDITIDSVDAFKIISQKAQEGDDAAIGLLKYIGEYLALHIIEMEDATGLKKAIITGGMCQGVLGDYIISNTRESLTRRGRSDIGIMTIGKEIDAQYGGAEGGIYLANTYWRGGSITFSPIDVYHNMIASLSDEDSINKWQDVFDIFYNEAKSHPDSFEKVTLYFEIEKDKFSEFTILIPKKLNAEHIKIVTRYLTACINNRIVTKGARKIVVRTNVKGLFTRLKESFDEYYNSPGATVKLKDTVSDFFGMREFKIIAYRKDMKMHSVVGDKDQNVTETTLKKARPRRPIKAIGISIGKQKLKIGIMEIAGHGVYNFVGKTWETNTWEKGDDKSRIDILLAKIVKGVRKTIRDAGVDIADIDGIGIAAATAVKEGKPLSVPMGFAREFTRSSLERLQNLQEELSARFGNLPIVIDNDGDTEAIGVARSKILTNVLVIKCGNTPGIGFVGADGEVAGGLGEFGKVVTDMNKNAIAHNKTAVTGELASYMAWDGIEKVAKRAGIYEKYGFQKDTPVPKILQDWINGNVETTREQREDAKSVFMEGGIQLGRGIKELSGYYPIENVVVTGGIYFGEAGAILEKDVRNTLAQWPDLDVNFSIDRNNKKITRYGGVIGGGYLVYDLFTKRSEDIKAENLEQAVRYYKKTPHIFVLTPKIAEYDWGGRTNKDGSPSTLRELLGLPASDRPAAEIWYGSHPKLPSGTKIFGYETTLDQLIGPLADIILGNEVIQRFGRRMPILFKFLDAHRTLSIQCHPYPELAEKLHRANPTDYPDPYNKPEAFVAITDEGFVSLANIKPIEEFIDIMEGYSAGIRSRYNAEKSKGDFNPSDFVLNELRPFLESGNQQIIDEIMSKILNEYKAKKGEVLLSRDGDINSLRGGFIAEIEANSDNTIRVGWTSKKIDIPAFLQAANFSPDRKDLIKFQNTQKKQVKNCITTDSFALDIINLKEKESLSMETGKTFHLLVVYSGNVNIRGPDNRIVTLSRGQACLIPIDFATFQIESTRDAELFDAYVPIIRNLSIKSYSIDRVDIETKPSPKTAKTKGARKKSLKDAKLKADVSFTSTGDASYDALISEALNAIKNKKDSKGMNAFLSEYQWQQLTARVDVKLRISSSLQNCFIRTNTSDDKAIIEINKSILDTSDISREELILFFTYMLARELDKIVFKKAFCADMNLAIPDGQIEAVLILRQIINFWEPTEEIGKDRKGFVAAVRKLNKNNPIIDCNESYCKLIEYDFKPHMVEVEGKPRWLDVIKNYISENSGADRGRNVLYPWEYWDRHVKSLKDKELFFYRRWYRGYGRYWANVKVVYDRLDPKNRETEIKYIFAEPEDRELQLVPPSVIIDAMKQLTLDLPQRSSEYTANQLFDASQELSGYMVRQLLGAPKSFLEYTVFNLYGEEINLSDIDKIYVRHLKSGTFKEVYYIQVVMKEQYLGGPYEFALLVPKESALVAGYPACISPQEIDTLSQLYRHDNSIVPRVGAHVALNVFNEKPEPYWQRRDIYSIEYEGRDTVRFFDLFTLDKESKIKLLRNVISKYIVLWHRLGGYEFICDPTLENVCILDWNAKVIDVGAPTYDYDITHILIYLWNRISFDARNRSIFGSGDRNGTDKYRIPDRRFIFDGIMDAFVLSSGEGRESGIMEGVEFLRRLRDYPSYNMPDDLHKALSDYVPKWQDYLKKTRDGQKTEFPGKYLPAEGIRYRPLDEIEWSVVNETWESIKPDVAFSPNSLTFYDFLGVNYMAKSFCLAVARRAEFELPDINFKVEDLTTDQEECILDHLYWRFKRDKFTPDRLTLMFLKSLALKYSEKGGDKILELNIGSNRLYENVIERLKKIIDPEFEKNHPVRSSLSNADAIKKINLPQNYTLEKCLFAANPQVLVVEDDLLSSVGSEMADEAIAFLNTILKKGKLVVIISDERLESLIERYGGKLEPSLLKNVVLITRRQKVWARFKVNSWEKEKEPISGRAEVLIRLSSELNIPLWNFVIVGNTWDIPISSLLGVMAIRVDKDEVSYYISGGIGATGKPETGGVLKVLTILSSIPSPDVRIYPYRGVSTKISSFSLPANFKVAEEFSGYDALVEFIAEETLNKQKELARKKMLISISGMVGAGKSNISDKIAETLRKKGANVVYFAEDDFIIERSIRDEWERTNDPRFNNHKAYHNWPQLFEVLNWVRDNTGEKKFTGLYNKKTGKTDAERMLNIRDDTIIIYEGLYQEDPTMYEPETFQMRFHFTISFMESFERTVIRNMERTGRTREEAERKETAIWPTVADHFRQMREYIIRGQCILIDTSQFNAPKRIVYEQYHKGRLAREKRIRPENDEGPKDKNLSLGNVYELEETHLALESAANDGRMFAVTVSQLAGLSVSRSDVEELVDLFLGNLVNLRSPPETRSKLLEKLKDPTFRENLTKGFRLIQNSIKGPLLPQDKPIRLCIVVEDKNLPTIVFKDPFNNLVAHSGKGEKTNTPYISIYAGYNSLEVALKSDQEDSFKKIINHEADDIVRGYHLDEKNTEAATLYDNVLDLYEVQSATVLLTDLLYAQLHEAKIYEIKYDISKLSPSQIDIIETYVSLLQKRASNPNNIKARPFSSAKGSKESLIAVYCTGKNFNGEGHVDINIPEGNIHDYLLRVTGMINIALAASNIPTSTTEEELRTSYGSIIGFIKNRYKEILGSELVIPDSIADALKALQYIVLTLPRAYRVPIDKIEEYNGLAKQALISA